MNKKEYVHLNQFDRDRIESLLDNNSSQKEIANILEIDPSTISREIKRNRRRKRKNNKIILGKYKATVANHKAYARRKYAKWQGKKIEDGNDLKEFIIIGLKSGWSPTEISDRMKEQKKLSYISKTAIYEWLYSIYGQKYCVYLDSRQYNSRKRKIKKTQREIIPNRVNISERPIEVSLGLISGHFEGDTIVSGKRTRSKSALAVATDIKTKYMDLEMMEDMKPSSFNQAMEKIKNGFNHIESLTLDNGQENRDYEKLGIKTYFCDPYSPYQKPRVENRNRFIRKFIKKGSDIGKYSLEYVKMIASIWNNKPLKSLGFRTPTECMVEAGLLKQKEQPNFNLIILKPEMVYTMRNIYLITNNPLKKIALQG